MNFEIFFPVTYQQFFTKCKAIILSPPVQVLFYTSGRIERCVCVCHILIIWVQDLRDLEGAQQQRAKSTKNPRILCRRGRRILTEESNSLGKLLHYQEVLLRTKIRRMQLNLLLEKILIAPIAQVAPKELTSLVWPQISLTIVLFLSLSAAFDYVAA